MLKKTIGLVVAATAIIALAVVPLSATADLVPTPGHTCKTKADRKAYCKRKCIVPNVVGERLKVAKQDIRKHDCKVGKIKRSERDQDKKGHKGGDAKGKHPERGKGHEKIIVVKQSPKGGSTQYEPGHRVSLKVKT